MNTEKQNGQVINLPASLCDYPQSLLDGTVKVVLKFLFVLFLLFKEERYGNNSGGHCGNGTKNRDQYSKSIVLFQNEHLRLLLSDYMITNSIKKVNHRKHFIKACNACRKCKKSRAQGSAFAFNRV
jgi:hypothetical protein